MGVAWCDGLRRTGCTVRIACRRLDPSSFFVPSSKALVPNSFLLLLVRHLLLLARHLLPSLFSSWLSYGASASNRMTIHLRQTYASQPATTRAAALWETSPLCLVCGALANSQARSFRDPVHQDEVVICGICDEHADLVTFTKCERQCLLAW